jgi:3',5'-cyclic AMP phosphodiesterase CpdA
VVNGVVTIAHVSDVHFGAQPPGAVDALVDDVAAARPALTVVTGDLTMRARPVQFRAAAALLDRLPAPVLVVPGNHDIPLHRPAVRLLAPYRPYRDSLGAPPATWLDLPGPPGSPGLRVVGVVSAVGWRWAAGAVGAGQVAGMAALLGEAAPGAVRVVALHHPVGQRGFAGLAGRRRMLGALGRAGADLVLAGHTHRPAAGLLPVLGRRVLEVVAGTATSTRTREAGRSWTLVRIAGRTVTVEHRYLGPPVPAGSHLSRFELGWAG